MKSILAERSKRSMCSVRRKTAGPSGGLVAADALEDAGAVVEGVREDVYLRLVPIDKLAVHPDLVDLRQ